jgi:hypothetical protein
MSTFEPEEVARAIDVDFDEHELTVSFADGRRLIVPLSWFPRLLQASPEQRRHWRLIGRGEGIHWPELDEDISVEGLLHGASAPGASPRAR